MWRIPDKHSVYTACAEPKECQQARASRTESAARALAPRAGMAKHLTLESLLQEAGHLQHVTTGTLFPTRAPCHGGGIRLASGRDMIPRAGFKTANTSLCCHGSATEQTEPRSCSTGDSSNEVCARQALCVVPCGCGGHSPLMACAFGASNSRQLQLMSRTSA